MYSNHSNYSLRSHNISRNSTPTRTQLSQNFGLVRPKLMSTNPTPQQLHIKNMIQQQQQGYKCRYYDRQYNKINSRSNAKSENNYCSDKRYDNSKLYHHKDSQQEYVRSDYRVRKTNYKQFPNKISQQRESTQKHSVSKTQDIKSVYSIHNKRPNIQSNASPSSQQHSQTSRSQAITRTHMMDNSIHTDKILKMQKEMELLPINNAKFINYQQNLKLKLKNKNSVNQQNKVNQRLSHEIYCNINNTNIKRVNCNQQICKQQNPEQHTIRPKLYQQDSKQYSKIGSIKHQYRQDHHHQLSQNININENKQLPLSSSTVDDFNVILLQQQYQNQFNKYQQLKSNATSIKTKKKLGGYTDNIIHCQKQLIDQINQNNNYVQYRHRYRLRQKQKQKQSQQNSKKLQKYQNIYTSKHIQSGCVPKFEVDCKWTIQQIMKLVHYPYYDHNSILISIKIPLFFQQMPSVFTQQSQLKFKAMIFLQQLSIKIVNLSAIQIQILKQNECLAFIYQIQHNEQYCLVWYPDGSVYMGQSHNSLRHGKGIQWVPDLYVYVGQYHNNMRHGYGIMKRSDRVVYAGLWQYDVQHGYGRVIAADGQVYKDGLWRNGNIVNNGKNCGFAQLT